MAEKALPVQRHLFSSRSKKPEISCFSVVGSSILMMLDIELASISVPRLYKSNASGSRIRARQNRLPSKC